MGEMIWKWTKMEGNFLVNSNFVLLGFLKTYVCQFKKSKTIINNYEISKAFLSGLAFIFFVLSLSLTFGHIC